MDQDSQNKFDLKRLRARLREKPRTKAGQVRQAWPEIKALLDAGHSLKDIRVWLNEAGIDIGYARLSDYVVQLRRRNSAPIAVEPSFAEKDSKQPEQQARIPGREFAVEQENGDPLSNIQNREQRRPGFNYNSEPDSKKLI